MNVTIDLTLYMKKKEHPVFLTTTIKFDMDYVSEGSVNASMASFESFIKGQIAKKEFLNINTIAVDMAYVQAASWRIYKETEK